MKRTLGQLLREHADALAWITLGISIFLLLLVLALAVWLFWRILPRSLEQWLDFGLFASLKAPTTGAFVLAGCYSYIWAHAHQEPVQAPGPTKGEEDPTCCGSSSRSSRR